MTALTGMNVQRKNNKITDPLIAECVCNEGISAFFLFVCNIVKRCVILNPKVTTWGVIMKTKDKDQGIDFVIAWVDGNDPEWQEEKKNTRIQKGIFSVDDNALSVNINRIREKLAGIGLTDFIKTKHRQGYTI